MKKIEPGARQILKQLQLSKNFVFHGSLLVLSRLRPRQPMNFDYKIRQFQKDGRPAVCATPFLETAIFHAVVSPNGWTSFGTTNGKMVLRASPEALQRTIKKKKVGYVYVFPKTLFKRHSRYEYRILRAIVPLATVRVTIANIPKKIVVIRNWRKWSPYKKHKTVSSAVQKKDQAVGPGPSLYRLELR